MFCHVSRAPLLDGREAQTCSASHRGVTIWWLIYISRGFFGTPIQCEIPRYFPRNVVKVGLNVQCKNISTLSGVQPWTSRTFKVRGMSIVIIIITSYWPPHPSHQTTLPRTLIIDWSMDIYDFCSDWSISSMDTAVVSLYPIEWLNFKVYLKDFIKRKRN